MSREIIPEEGEIIKYAAVGEKERNQKDIFVIAVIILTGLLGFGLGRLSKIDAAREPITIEYPAGEESKDSTLSSQGSGITTNAAAIPRGGKSETTGPIVASKNGTKYYFTWCPGASRISEKNKVYFTTAAAAEARGLNKATNCPGL